MNNAEEERYLNNKEWSNVIAINNTILLTGIINDTAFKNLWAIITNKKVEQGDKLPNIDLIINSEGGDVTTCLAIYSLLKHYSQSANNPLVTTIGIGQVCSGALFVLLGGTKGFRYAYDTTIFYEHDIYMLLDNRHSVNRSLLTSEIKGIDILITQCNNILCSETDMDNKDIQKLLLGPHYFDAYKALEMGVIDHIITTVNLCDDQNP